MYTIFPAVYLKAHTASFLPRWLLMHTGQTDTDTLQTYPSVSKTLPALVAGLHVPYTRPLAQRQTEKRRNTDPSCHDRCITAKAPSRHTCGTAGRGPPPPAAAAAPAPPRCAPRPRLHADSHQAGRSMVYGVSLQQRVHPALRAAGPTFVCAKRPSHGPARWRN